MTLKPASSRTIGIVTVTYNSGIVLDGFFDSLGGQTYADYRLYCIDNASRDNSVERVGREAATDHRIRLVANPDNRGVAKGNNQGIRAALADGCGLILLINNDVEFPAGLLAGMVDALHRLDAQMLVPKIYYHTPATRLWCAGGTFDAARGYATRHYGEDEEDRGQFDQPRRVEFSPTCCMLVRKSVFDSVGLMDESYFVYGDDSDFCWRVQRAGLALWYAPETILYHKVSSLTGHQSDFTHLNSARGRGIFLRKHCGAAGYFWLAAYWIWLLCRALPRRNNWHVCAVQTKGLCQGLAVPISHAKPA